MDWAIRSGLQEEVKSLLGLWGNKDDIVLARTALKANQPDILKSIISAKDGGLFPHERSFLHSLYCHAQINDNEDLANVLSTSLGQEVSSPVWARKGISFHQIVQEISLPGTSLHKAFSYSIHLDIPELFQKLFPLRHSVLIESVLLFRSVTVFSKIVADERFGIPRTAEDLIRYMSQLDRHIAEPFLNIVLDKLMASHPSEFELLKENIAGSSMYSQFNRWFESHLSLFSSDQQHTVRKTMSVAAALNYDWSFFGQQLSLLHQDAVPDVIKTIRHSIVRQLRGMIGESGPGIDRPLLLLKKISPEPDVRLQHWASLIAETLAEAPMHPTLAYAWLKRLLFRIRMIDGAEITRQAIQHFLQMKDIDIAIKNRVQILEIEHGHEIFGDHFSDVTSHVLPSSIKPRPKSNLPPIRLALN
jgi:hypothetical protein